MDYTNLRVLRSFSIIFLFIFGVGALNAVAMVSPVEKEINNGDIVYIGVIGPGQTLSILIKPHVTSGGLFGQGGDYDNATVSALPNGWKGQGSEFYGDPLQVKITADKNAAEGDYYTNITISDELGGEKLGNITYTVKIKVQWNVMQVEVSPQVVKVGPSQPARIYITVKNTGTASDTFEINGQGLKRWEFSKNVYLAPGNSKTIPWEIVENEQETYSGTINVFSTSSPDIVKYEKNITVNVVPQSIFGDYKATNNGIIVFPIFESLIYALAGVISNLF